MVGSDNLLADGRAVAGEVVTGASLDSVPGMLLYVPGDLFELILPIADRADRARLATYRRTIHAADECRPAHAAA